MADEKQLALANNVYKTLCAVIEKREWTYKKIEPDLIVFFIVQGEDIPMQFVMAVDAERQLIRVSSMLPFHFPEDKRIEGAVATCVASYGLTEGGFDYDISNGEVEFRLTSSFYESLIGEDLFQHMIDLSCATVDAYNDKLLALSKGLVGIDDFMRGENS